MRATRIHYSSERRLLELTFSDGTEGALSAEFLRVKSPSAEVRGHGPGDGQLVDGKEAVAISAIDPVGHYAIQLRFDDGHDSGLYTWAYLRELIEQHEQLWADYLRALQAAGRSRTPGVQVLTFDP